MFTHHRNKRVDGTFLPLRLSIGSENQCHADAVSSHDLCRKNAALNGEKDSRTLTHREAPHPSDNQPIRAKLRTSLLSEYELRQVGA
jgi:hypothetical protein